jgi:LDH2 family malate/lactate/ureidoglycolate dehydrogenase
VQLDAGLGFGQIGGVTAIDLAVERARQFGVATVSIRDAKASRLGVASIAEGTED